MVGPSQLSADIGRAWDWEVPGPCLTPKGLFLGREQGLWEGDLLHLDIHCHFCVFYHQYTWTEMSSMC